MISPVTVKNRVVQMDIIRGFALFGVLLVNITMIDATIFSYLSSPFQIEGTLNQLFAWLIHVLAVGKFYTMFSILFGLGFYFFMNKSNDTVVPPSLFLRRLGVLLLFGAFHLIFVWHGDILHTYAITGVLLLLYRNKDEKRILKTGLILFTVMTLFLALLSMPVAQESEISKTDEQNSQNSKDEFSNLMQSELEYSESIYYYQQPSYQQMLQYRVKSEVPLVLMNLILIVPKILSLFLIGYYIGKRRLFHKLEENKTFIHKVWIHSLWCSILCIVLYTGIEGEYFFVDKRFLGSLADEISTLTLALFYITSLIKLYETKLGKKVIKPLRYTGQMALTNYLIQTIFFTTLVCGYGFNLFGKIEYWMYLPMAILFYSLQILLSKLWLSQFSQGPMEKLWRFITYWKTH